MSLGLGYGSPRRSTPKQEQILAADLGYDDGGRFALVAVSGYEISERAFDSFGTVFSVIDCDSGDEVEQSNVIGSAFTRDERRHWIARVRFLNGREDAYA